MRKLFFIFALAILAMQCTKHPAPAQSGQWFCSTLADQQTNPLDTATGFMQAVAYKDKFWPVGYKFKVGFIGGNPSQISLVKTCAAEWAKAANLAFEYPTAGPYDIRVAFNSGGGAWSYVGTDCKNISASQPTMNLGWLAKDAYLHELGHAVGLLHEHQSPDHAIKWNETAVIKDLSGPPNNWTVDMIRYNVLNPYPLPNVITTALDKLSIMMYPIPVTWTLDGFTTPGGLVLSDVDKKFIGERYPFTQPPTTGSVTLRKGQVDTLLIQYDALIKASDAAAIELKKANDLTKKAFGRLN